MQLVKHIPNFLTSLNVLCGTLALFFAITGYPQYAVWLIFAGALFDFSDGFAARALKAYSDIGKELDSLADLISFGAAPAAIWSAILKYQLTGGFSTPFFDLSRMEQIWVLIPFVLVAFAALRLAKFNVDTRQTENFLGLTTTATGIFTAALAYKFIETPNWFEWMSPITITIAIIFFSLMLVSEVPMTSLKFKNLKWPDNKERFVLLLLAIVFTALLGVGGIAALILYYVVTSLGKWILKIK